jgi:PTS system mannose-specific IIA component
MIGIILVTHGRLADELSSALQHVVGPQTALATVCIGPEDDMDKHRLEIIDRIRQVDAGQGVVLLTDMFGGTPSNLAISVMEGRKVEVIAGVNLPMLVKLASVRDHDDLATAVVKAQEAGRKYINVASAFLSGAC